MYHINLLFKVNGRNHIKIKIKIFYQLYLGLELFSPRVTELHGMFRSGLNILRSLVYFLSRKAWCGKNFEVRINLIIEEAGFYISRPLFSIPQV